MKDQLNAPTDATSSTTPEFALSSTQRRLWFLQQFHPDSAAYNVPLAWRIHGPLEVEALRAAMNDVVARHDILRTRFVTRPDGPVQIIDSSQQMTLEVADVSRLDDAALRHRIAEEGARPFDLEHGAVRVRLLRRAEDEHILLLTLHHIVCDGWSLSIINRELGRCYAARLAGAAWLAEQPQLQYADFAAWEQETRAGDVEAHVEYWRDALLGHEDLRLPADFPRPPVQSTRGGSLPIHLDRHLTRALHQLAAAESVSPFMVLSAAFAVVLSRQSGQQQFVVGSPAANRDMPQTHDCVGPFAGMLVLPVDCSGGPRFRELLAHVRTATVQALSHQDASFERIVDSLGLARDPSRHPIFQVSLAYQNVPDEPLALGGLTVEAMGTPKKAAMFDLSLFFFPVGDQIAGSVEYSTDLFTPETVRRLLAHVVDVLAAAVRDPDLSLAEIPLTAGATPAAGPATAGKSAAAWVSVVEGLSGVVGRCGGLPAVEFGSEVLSFAGLSRRVDELAGRLGSLGVGRGDRVGVVAQRGVGLVVAVWGLWRAGAAFVPLDPGLPASRLALMVADAGVSVVVVPAGGAGVVDGCRVVELSADGGVLGSADGGLVDGQAGGVAGSRTVGPGDAAYVLFTSGSTGRPKAVVVDHGGVAGLLAGLSSVVAPGVTGQLRVSVNASLAFDACVQQLVQLVAGHCLVVIDEQVRRDPQVMVGFLCAAGVDVLDCTPTQLRGLLRAGLLSATGGPSVVLVGGEPLDQRLWDELGSASQVRVVNLYGLTECSVDSTAAVVRSSGPVPCVGWPLAGVQAYVVDVAGRLVGPGVVGELWLGGPGLAQGYLGDPVLTASRFVPDGFGGVAGRRLLRTGDLVRWQPDGSLVFVGRADGQVKVRGYRVELGEIEQVLLAHPEVEQAAVIARTDTDNNTHLTAYVRTASIEQGSIRSWLQQSLPPQAIPSQIVRLDPFPTTASGKIDYASLPAAVEERSNGADYVGPSTDAEATLAVIWGRVLGRASVGVHDNFFEIGGDSILSLQITAQACEAGLALTTRQIFEFPTIAQLARLAQPTAEPEAGPRPERAPLSPAQEWFMRQGFTEPNHWNMTRTLTLPDGVEQVTVQRAVAYLFARHEAFRARIVLDDGSHVQWVSPVAQPPALQTLDLSDVDPADHAIRLGEVLDGLQASLDLEAGPIMRALLLVCPGETRELVMVVHHTAVDAVSWSILAEDLAGFFAGVAESLPAPVVTQPYSFMAWSARVAEAAAANRLESDWWLEAIPDQVEPLPVDNPQAVDVEGAQLVHEVVLDWERTAALQSAAAKLRARPHELVLAAFAAALGSWSGRDGVLVEIEGHGREQLVDGTDVDRTVGWFTSLSPLWIDELDGDVLATLAIVKRRYRAVPQRGAGYGAALRYSADSALLAAKPVPQVVFNYLGDARSAGSSDPRITVKPDRCKGTRAASNRRPHLLVADVQVEDGQLKLYLAYGPQLHPGTIEQLASAFDGKLAGLAASSNRALEAWVPEDFPLADLTTKELQRVCRQYDDIADIFALTPTQEGLLFHSLLEPTRGLYIEQRAWTFEGALDRNALVLAWEQMVALHPVFRTVFCWEGVHSPVQIVRNTGALDLVEYDLAALDQGEHEQRISDLLVSDQLDGFELRRGQAMRIKVLVLDERRWILVWTVHHLLLDGWSNAILVREFFDSYAALVNGVTHAATPRPTMREFVRWKRGSALPGAEEYWRDRLQGFATPTSLGLRSPDAETAGFVELVVPVPAGLLARLETMAKHRRLTLNTVVEGAWAMLMARYSGDQDVVFGAVSAGRPPQLPGVEDLIGLCITTLPVRVQVDPAEPVERWLAGLQTDQVRQREFEQTPLVDVQGFSSIPHGQPLFDTLLVFENYPLGSGLEDALGRAGLSMTDELIVSPVSYTVRCCFVPGRDAKMIMGFHRDRVDLTDAEHLGRQLVRLLEDMADRPDAALGDFRLLPAEAEPDPAEPLTTAIQPTVPELVAAWSTQTPHAAALVQGGTVLTYADLHQVVRDLATALRRSGLRPGDAVAVTGEKSAGLIAAMLAVLDANGVLVPIDPSSSSEVQEASATAARCRAVVAVGGVASLRLPSFAVSADGELVGQEALREPVGDPYGADVAYVMFTSGSTGTAKGVVGSHRGLSHFLQWQRDTFAVAPGDVLLQLTRLAFDVVLRDVFLPLASGATLALPRSHDALGPDEVMAALAEYGVTLLHTVPSLADHWVMGRSPQVTLPSTLRTVFFAGEPLTGELVDRWRAVMGAQLEVVNLYGPTETTLAVCAYRVPVPAAAGVLPLGRPLPGAQVLVLDQQGRQRAVGEPGELVIRSPYRSHGYLGPAGSGFAANHLWAMAPEEDLLFHTKDMGRRRPDGSLEFLGRSDDQVKIRGVRVDVQEVAGTAVQHPGVAACTVVVRQDVHGEQMLVGYVLLDASRPTDHTSIRDYMRRVLPANSVPSAFVTMTEFPRLLSGKIDHRALPAPTLRRSDQPGECVAPTTPMERRLCEIWAESMHLEQVGVTDDFFELGGHSLIATALVSRLREELNVAMPLRVLFDTPTVRGQAAWIDANGQVAAGPEQEAGVSRSARESVEATYRKLQELPEDVRRQILGTD